MPLVPVSLIVMRFFDKPNMNGPSLNAAWPILASEWLFIKAIDWRYNG